MLAALFLASAFCVLPRALATTINLGTKAQSVEDVLELLRESSVGAPILRTFDLKIKSGAVQIVNLTPQVRKEQGFLPNEHAHFDASSQRIYIDLSEEVGLLAPTLLHEIVHATDDEWAASRKKLTASYDKLETELAQTIVNGQDDKDVKLRLKTGVAALEPLKQAGIFKSERKAFDAEFAFRKELWTKNPAYLDYLHAKERQLGLYLTENPSDDQLMALYGLNPAIVKKGLQSDLGGTLLNFENK